MTCRVYTLYVCGCDGRLWTRDELDVECWLCKTKVRQVEAHVTDEGETAVFDPAQGKLL